MKKKITALAAALFVVLNTALVLQSCSAKKEWTQDGLRFSLEGGARVYAVKVPEAGAGLVLRLADVGGEGASYTLRFPKAVAAAELLDVNENVLAAAAVDGGAVRGAIDPYAVVTLRVRFAE